jgi:alcohol dehydrogenase class IV
MLSAIGVLATLPLLERQSPDRVRSIANAMGLEKGQSVADGVKALMARVDLPTSLSGIGYSTEDVTELAGKAAESHFNLTGPYAPTKDEFVQMIGAVLA